LIVNRIKHEAFGPNSMETAFCLTDVHGPRLTGSSQIKSAAEWTVKTLNEWGMADTKMETWGPFGRGWNCTRFTAMLKEPEFSPLIGFARPWSPGTEGAVVGQAILAALSTQSDPDKYKGKLGVGSCSGRLRMIRR
jgi:carboxypeptidase Q